MTATLRHQPGSNRAPVRGKPAQRGASRLVAKEPISLRVSLPRDMQTLSEAGTIIVIHHPPLPPLQDAAWGWVLAHPEELADVVRGTDVRHMGLKRMTAEVQGTAVVDGEKANVPGESDDK